MTRFAGVLMRTSLLIVCSLAGLVRSTAQTVASAAVMRMNVGGSAWTSSTGERWLADNNTSSQSRTFSTTAAISGTTTPEIYRTERFTTQQTLRYQYLVPNGTYTVRLMFAEIAFRSTRQRVFSVRVNGAVWNPGLDIIALAGPNRALDLTRSVTVNNGVILIELGKVVENPKLNGVVITQTSAPATTVPQAPVTITSAPAAVTLQPGQQQSFTATVSNTSNTGVTWTLSPPVGAITANGVYTAPPTVAAATTVSVIAQSAADPTRTATSLISLRANPPADTTAPSVTITSPLSGSSVSGTVLVAANASDDSAVAGVRLLVNGQDIVAERTAPPYQANWNTSGLASGTYTIAAMARDQAGNITTRSIQVILPAPAPTPAPTAPAPVVLPVEVGWPEGTVRSTQVNLPSVGAGPYRLWMRVHNLKHETQMSVRLNGGLWVAVNSRTAAIEGLGKSYAGIGGGFHTLDLSVPLPTGAVVSGNNTVEFRFDRTDGVVSAYRVLAFNLLDGAGSRLLSSAAFTQDDPAGWQAPSSNVAGGRQLWYTAAITRPVPGGSPLALQAKCADCHAQDGRDLKYFNYSNQAIVQRAQFHGLTAEQGAQLAAYVRSLSAPAPAPARPWNPPYQPGPGLSARPVGEWAAGAGLDAVLTRDRDMLPFLTPNGDTSGWAVTANLNQRDTPVALQMPDWNMWLPAVHPKDMWPTQFANSQLETIYQSLRSQLLPGDGTVYRRLRDLLSQWGVRDKEFVLAVTPNWDSTAWQNPTTARAVYGIRQWRLVKMWELMQEFQLEGLGKEFFGSYADSRAWPDQSLFFVSPHMMRIPASPGLGNGTVQVRTYLAFAWYHMQLLLNDGFGQQEGNNPIDWPYVYGFIFDLSNQTASRPQAGLQMLWLVRGAQLMGNPNRPGPDVWGKGWDWVANDLSRMVHPSMRPGWGEMSYLERQRLQTAVVSNWLSRVRQFTPQQFWAIVANPNDRVNGMMDSGRMVDRVAYVLPQLRANGVDPALLSQMVAWTTSIWPNYNWSAALNATCSGPADGLTEFKCAVPTRP